MKKIKILIALLALFIFTGCNTKKVNNENTNKKNSIEVSKQKNVDGFEFSTGKITYKDGISTFETKIKNNNKENIEIKYIMITVYDKNNTVITEIPGYIGETIKKNETKKISSSIDIDLTNTKKIEYKIVK